MLKIGEFSRLSQVTIATLHHYDDIGLLKPAHVDKFTSHRYYTLEQLLQIHRIMALKELGLSLEEVHQLLQDELTVNELRGMFKLRQGEIESRLRDEQKRLMMVKFHLRMIEVEDEMSEINAIVKQVDPLTALTLRIAGNDPMQIVAVGREVQQAIAEQSVKVKGPHMGIVYGDEVNLEDYEYEFVIPIETNQSSTIPLQTQGTLRSRELPQVTAVTHVFSGADQTVLLENKVLLQRWALENGYTLKNEMRSIHFRGPMHGGPPNEWVTELQVIVEKEPDQNEA